MSIGDTDGQVVLFESFDQPKIDGRLNWLNTPRQASIRGGCLWVETGAGTDFWQRTHYGFREDSGHFLYAKVEGNFLMRTSLRYRFFHQFDQAGLMVRVTPQCWIKASLEYEVSGPAKLGAVVTNSGFSDWSTQDFLLPKGALHFQIERREGDYFVGFSADPLGPPSDEPAWSHIRTAHLLEDCGDKPIRAGLYACSPKGKGFVAEFDYLSVERTG